MCIYKAKIHIPKMHFFTRIYMVAICIIMDRERVCIFVVRSRLRTTIIVKLYGCLRLGGIRESFIEGFKRSIYMSLEENSWGNSEVMWLFINTT